jgi:hypothetical protein
MMPLALALLYLVQKLLSMLFVVDDMALVPIAPLGGAGSGGLGNVGERNRPVLRTAGVDLRPQPAHSGDRPRGNPDQREHDAG